MASDRNGWQGRAARLLSDKAARTMAEGSRFRLGVHHVSNAFTLLNCNSLRYSFVQQSIKLFKVG
jgi:hypothetical protein